MQKDVETGYVIDAGNKRILEIGEPDLPELVVASRLIDTLYEKVHKEIEKVDVEELSDEQLDAVGMSILTLVEGRLD